MSDDNSKGSVCTTLWNALALDANLYENARNTPKTHELARTIVILAAVSHALGSAVILLINLAPVPIFVGGLLMNGFSVVGGYYFWTLTIWKIGQRLRRNSPSYGDLLSPIGFAYAPQVLNFLTLIPLVGQLIELVLAVWSLLAVTVAVRQGLNISTPKAILICLIGWPLIQAGVGFIQVLEQRLVETI